MSIYTLPSEPKLTALADADMICVHDASPSRAGTITAALARNYMHSGVVAVTASTLALTAADHSGRLVTIDRAAGMVITLPVSAGTGDKYELWIKATTAGTTTIKVPAASVAIMQGFAILGQDSGNATEFYATGADTDTITLYVSGSTTGGIVGARIMLQDVATALWRVEYFSDAAGSEATPFSATV
jgi:hypothetical protein